MVLGQPAQKNGAHMLRLFISLIFILSSLIANAANIYVRDGGSATNCRGTDWNTANACDSLAVAEGLAQRGDTIYLAYGTYGGATFDAATSGSTYIYIKKATSTDHGTSTGWNSSYGDAPATIGALNFTTGYYDVDGVTGGGPSSWSSGYGIVVSTSVREQIKIGNVTNVSLKHVDVKGISRTSQVGQWGVYAVSGGSDITLSYCRFYDQQKLNIALYSVDNVLIEYCKIGPNGQSGVTYIDGSPMHKIGLSLRNNDTLTVRYNLFEDISETCYIGFVNDAAGEVAKDWSIYGNIFFDTRTLVGSKSSILLSFARSNTTVTNFKFYNNTIANMNNMSNVGLYSIAINGGGNVMQNNIWYNNVSTSLGFGLASHSYNYYNTNVNTIGTSINPTSESNVQIATGVPFQGMASRNFSLLSGTSQGISLSSPFNTDLLGSTRGGDGTWDRGAVEFVSTGDSTIPTISRTSPTSSATYNTTDSTITVSGTASDNVGVTSVDWNSSRSRSGTCTGTTSWTCSNIQLDEGSNVLTFTAWDAAYNSAYNTFTVDRTIIDNTAPVFFNPVPTGTIPCASDPISLTEQVTTDEAATVKYATSAEWAGGTDTYDEMSSIMTTTGGTLHSRTVSRACGASYQTYFLAEDIYNNKTATEDVAIASYTVAAATGSEFISGIKFGENSGSTVNGVVIDAYISEINPTSKYFSTPTFYLSTDGSGIPLTSVLIRINTSSIPTNSVINAARLYLYLTSVNAGYDLEATIHKIISKDWWSTGLSNWTKYDGTNLWTTAGGYGDIGTAIDTITFTTETNGITTASWYSFNVASAISDFVATPASNYGLLIASDQGSNHAPYETFREIATSQYSDSSLRPILIVDYTVPPPGSTNVSKSGSLSIGGFGTGNLTLRKAQ